jgi:hypothetical protein
MNSCFLCAAHGSGGIPMKNGSGGIPMKKGSDRIQM